MWLALLLAPLALGQDSPLPSAPVPPAAASSAALPEAPTADLPEAAQPEAAQPEAAQPEAAQPEAAQPEAAQPAAALPAAALPAAAQLAPADEALLVALLSLLSDQEGTDGATALGALADPRALWVLRHSVTHREPVVAGAAALALSAFPEAVPDLQRWVLDPTLDDGVRSRAAESLGRRSTGAGAILTAMGQRQTSDPLRDALRQVLAAHFPERLAEAEAQVVRDGTPWLMIAGGSGLAYALASAGYFGQNDLQVVGGLAGALGGATGGYYLGLSDPMEAGDAALIATSGLAGMTAGTLIGGAVYGGGGAPWAGGLLGGAMAYGLSIPATRRYAGSEDEALVGLGVGVVSGSFALSTFNFVAQDQRVDGDTRAAVWGAGMALGTVAGHLYTPRANLTGDDWSMITLAAGYGLYAGAVAPLSPSVDQGSLPWATGNAAALLAYGLSPQVDMPRDITLSALTGLGYGAVGGALLGVVVAPDDGSLQQAMSLALGTGAMAAGGYAAWRTEGDIQPNDAVLTGLVTGWSTWQAMGWAYVLQADDPQEVSGAGLVPVVLGGATALATPKADIQFSHSLSAASLGLWGAYLGSVGGILADGSGEQVVGSALVVSDVGLLGGALLMSPRVGAAPMVVGLANAGGVVGGATGALVAAMATAEQKPILAASLLGAAAGAAGGAAAGRALQGRELVAGLHAPALPSGLAVTPRYFPTGDGAVWGAELSLSGW
ncbi:MAG: HEAT repeat domain-containing protein [Deltaproteobacteria bacterium]|nr:HEAT repeat domain-containing protein [Deltaproteobacteria bacterium]